MNTILAMCVLSGFLAGNESYPRADLLVEAAHLPNLKEATVILDARPRDKYLAGHLPKAIFVDHDQWSKTFAAKQDAKTWSAIIGGLGIEPGATVVVYDDAMQKDGARIWWILRYFGAKDVRLVNGGWHAISTSGLPTSKEEATPRAANFPIAAPVAGRLADKQKVADLLKAKTTTIVDARSEKEYCGDAKLAKRGGHIPGAVLLEWSELLEKDSKKFKNSAALAKLMKDAGIDVEKPAVTHCQSGGRASVMAFALELMGVREVANYYRGWSEWGNDAETTIAK